MEIDAVEGELVGVSLSGGDESEVKIDQQLEVGTDHNHERLASSGSVNRWGIISANRQGDAVCERD
jgi:hypothetical protein